MRAFGAWLRLAGVEAILAGVLTGLVEAGWLVGARGGGGRTLWVLAGLAVLAGVVAGVAVHALVYGLLRVPALKSWRWGIAAGGGPRAAAVARAAVVVVAVLAFAGATFAVASYTHGAFHEAQPIALLEAAVLPVLAVAIVLAASWAARRVLPRVEGARGLHAWLDGARGRALAIVTLLALAGGGVLVARRAAPAASLAVPTGVVGFLVALAAARIARVGARRPAWAVAGVALAGAVAALFALPSAPGARALALSYGAMSRGAMRVVWAMADRDGDGYPAAFVGGADCDDGDAAISPAAAEILDNGVDENCSGADLTAAAVAHRLAPRPSAFPGAPRWNVLLISVDALRADHLGAWGYARKTSPRLDALAAGATRFAWAVTSSPTTRRAIPTLATGRLLSALEWRRGGSRMAPSSAPTLAEILGKAGYDTAAINCCKVLFGEKQGALAGMDRVDATADAKRDLKTGRNNGDELARKVVAYLRDRKARPEPFLLWTHFIDPHHPYARMPSAPDFGKRELDRYDSEVAYTDEHIGKILAALDETGLAARTIVVVTADHGEEFGEHGIRFHAGSLYNQVVRIPLIVRYPGAPAGVVDTPVSLADVTPTVLDLLGLDAPAGTNGVSLAAAVRGQGAAPVRPVLSELVPDATIKRDLAAVYHQGWKLVWDRDANTYELYALSDPADRDDRAAREPARVDELSRLLRETTAIEAVTPR